MSSARSGSTMRLTSRAPFWSNRQSSTFWAWAENSAKLVPRPSWVAPRRDGEPSESRMSALRHQEDGGQRRNDEAELRSVATVDGRHEPAVADVAAAIEPRIG